MLTYGEKLKSPKWQKRRLQVMGRDKFKCLLCGDYESELHVHHTKYFNEPWNVPTAFLKTVCHQCHWAVEMAKKYDADFPLKSVKRINENCIVVLLYKNASLFIDVTEKKVIMWCFNDLIHEVHNSLVNE